MRIKVDASTEPKGPTVRVGGIRHRRIPLKNQASALGEVTGLQIAGLRALARQGVQFSAEEVEKCESLARAVNSLSIAHARLNKEDDKPPTDEEIKRLAGVP